MHIRIGGLIVAGLFTGIRPTVAAIVLFVAWRIGPRAIRIPVLAASTFSAFVCSLSLHIDFPWIVIAAAVLGIIGGRLAPKKFQGSGGGHAAQQSHGAALIGDDSPPPSHARLSWSRLLGITIAFICLGGGFLLSLDGERRAMGEFFTKAAFLTIGGAYAVLPSVYQAAVEQHQWLTSPQMMDGLAQGETTPGPSIMGVAWVGPIGGVTKTVFPAPVATGLSGATVATFFTFLPSFWFILTGAPFVEASRGEPHQPAVQPRRGNALLLRRRLARRRLARRSLIARGLSEIVYDFAIWQAFRRVPAEH